MKVPLTKPLYLIIILLIFASCEEDYIPKPRGYFRIDFPEKKYTSFNPDDCPYKFEVPQYSWIVRDTIGLREPCWLDVNFPKYKAQLHLSYKPVEGNLYKYLEDSRTLVTKHIAKADGINEIPINNGLGAYGIVYDIKGNAASSIQFVATDSLNHFIRGALYFRCPPNKDSLSPVLEFIRPDIAHLINTLEWKD